ncbi:hypothetical protein K1719_020737 [Acacia pycnantha]|nr:hypothetical protein K1719_020737 [Acacia pycnantha]
MNKEWRVEISHVYRERNCCADWLASYALGLEKGLHFSQNPPDGIQHCLSEDAVGIGRLRHCLSPSDLEG